MRPQAKRSGPKHCTRSLRRRIRLACAFALALASLAVSASAQTRPSSYAEFDTSIAPGDAAALQAMIARGDRNFIYLRSGYYLLKNPVVIDRTTPLFLHGADRENVILAATNPTQPLFLVQNAQHMNFAGLNLWANVAVGATRAARAVATVNTQPVSVEFQDCVVEQSTLEFAGPGSYRVQSCSFLPAGRVNAPLMIDHPAADVLVFGGDVSNARESLRVTNYAHVWQKRGRL